MPIIRSTCCSLLLLGALSGCASTPVFHSDDLVVYGRHVRIDGVRPHRLADGSIEVVVRGYSSIGWDRPARYRAQWADAQGRPIATVVDNWFPVNLQGQRPFEFTMLGPGPAAVDYRIEIEILED